MCCLHKNKEFRGFMRKDNAKHLADKDRPIAHFNNNKLV